MPEFKLPRPGEVAIDLPATTDAGLVFIGRIRTPWPSPADCPRNSRERSETGTIEIFAPFVRGLADLERCSHVILLYWLDRARRDLIVQLPSHLMAPRGVFALRSPVRPNPIGLSVVELLRVDGARLLVRNIDCADGTPLIDIKPYIATTDSVPEARRP